MLCAVHRSILRPIACAALATAIACALSACGGGSSSSSTTSSAGASQTTGAGATNSTAGSATTSSGGTPTSSGGASVTTGPIRAVLHAENHSPHVNRPWPYSVRVTDAAGRPLGGRVDIEFVFGGQVVGRDTPPTHPLSKGRWHDNLKFPPDALGEPLSVRAVVHVPHGSVTLNWPISVVR